MLCVFRCVDRASHILFAISLALLAALMFLTATDVTGRLFGHPIRGVYQISEIMQVAVICFAWPFTTAALGHVRLEFFMDRFPPRVQNRIEILTHLISIIVFVVIGWQGISLAAMSMKLGDLVAIIDIPLFPFHLVVSLGAFVTCLVLAIRLTHLFAEGRSRRS